MNKNSLLRNTIRGLAIWAVLVGAVGQAQAGYMQIFTPGGLSGSDTTASYTGADGDVIASPYTLAAGGNTLTFTTDSGNPFQRVDQGTSWTGAFPDGTKLLWTLDPDSNTASSATIAFANPVLEVGLSVQQDDSAATTFTATAFSGTTAELKITVDVAATGALGFLGFKATGGDTITSIQISSTESNTSFNNDFAMGPVTFGSPPPPPNAVPEPSTLAIGTIGALGLVVTRWLRRRPPSA
jgi:hypothetical protein